MKIRQIEKNPDTNSLEIDIRFTADEIDFLNGLVKMFAQRQKGDPDDAKQIAIVDELLEGFYQARRKVKP